MRRLFILLALSSLACVVPTTLSIVPTGTPVPTALPTGTPVPTTYTAIGTVYIRSANKVVGYFEPGESVSCVLVGNWCELEDGAQVWAGCLDPNPLELGCEKR